MGIPICKNSRAAISLVTHCRVIPEVLSLFRIDRKGLCFDRLDIAGSAGGIVGVPICGCEVAAAAVPKEMALFDLGILGEPLNLDIGDREISFLFETEESLPPIIGDVDTDCWGRIVSDIFELYLFLLPTFP